MKKKLLFITDHWAGGGRERTLHSILANLSDEWDCELLILRRIRCKIEEEKRGSFPFPDNVKVSKIERGTIVPIFFALVKFLRDRKPHLISTHITPTGNLLLLIYLAKKLACPSSPLVVNNHDTLEFPVDELITYPLRKYILKRKIDCLVTISKGLEKIAETRWGIPREKLITIYNPIVGEEIFEDYPEPEEYKAFPGVPKIVAIARLDLDTKDFPTLLRAFALFKKRYEKAKLFIIGDGPDKEKIQEYANKLGLKDSIELLGFRANPYPYIKYADVLVHFSLVEALGRTIVEAMALGCPVVATDCPVGPRELIDNNENGILVPMKNPEKMAEAMSRIIDDEELRGRLMKNGKEIAQRFSALKSVRKREELFKKLLDI